MYPCNQPFFLINQFIPGGGFNPFKKYARQIGFIFPKFRGEHKKLLKPPPRYPCMVYIYLHLN